MSDMLKGKRGLVMGVANERSIAWGIAKALADLPLRLIEDSDGTNASRYDVDRSPNMFLIGRDGLIVSHHVGYTDKALDGLLAEISAELQKAPPDASS